MTQKTSLLPKRGVGHLTRGSGLYTCLVTTMPCHCARDDGAGKYILRVSKLFFRTIDWCDFGVISSFKFKVEYSTELIK